MSADNRLMVRISTEKKEAFMKKASEEGKNASEKLLELIDGYLKLSDKGDELEELRQELQDVKQKFGSEIAFLKQEMQQKLLGESAA
jgi:SMC interacting uncharacterized protein involved in chromosome segregation